MEPIDRKRLIYALELFVHRRKPAERPEFPSELKSYVLSYRGKDYAKITFEPSGEIELEPLRASIVPPEQLQHYLGVMYKILINQEYAEV